MKKIIIPAIVLCVLFVFTGCQKEVQEETVKIGTMLVLSGDGGAWGQASRRAIDLAVEEINNQGGIGDNQIEIIYKDTLGSPQNVLSIYNKFKNIDNVQAIIGPNMQTEMSVVAPLVNNDKFPLVSLSYITISDRPNKNNPLLVFLDIDVEVGRMADYIYSEDIRSISVLGTQDSWEKQVSNSFADNFIDLGGQIIFKDLLQSEEEGVGTVVSKAIENNPDAVFVGTYYQFLNITKSLKELGYEGKVYSIEIDEYLAGESKGFADGLQFISPDEYSEEFKRKYEERYGEKSNIPAGQSYDAAKILFSFLEKDSSREGILKQMREFREYDGVSGKIRITDDHRTLMPTVIYELQNGEIKKLQSYP